jgi:RimJ/RimL family protein N-acetyltransferase
MFSDITSDDVYRIETKRLWLRWPRLSDAPAIERYLSDRSIADMTSRIPHPYPSGEAERYVFTTRTANAEGAGLGLVMARLGSPTEIIGAIGLFSRDLPQTLELGYWIGTPHWGQGFATESVKAMIDAGFSLSKTDAVLAIVKPENAASIRVLERCGFAKAGEGERFMPARGQNEPVLKFIFPRDRWRGTSYWSALSPVA